MPGGVGTGTGPQGQLPVTRLGRWLFLPQLKNGDFLLFTEPDDLIVKLPQEPHDLAGRTIAAPDPDELRRCAVQDGQSVEVLIFTHEQAVVGSGEIPDGCVRRSPMTECSDVQ